MSNSMYYFLTLLLKGPAGLAEVKRKEAEHAKLMQVCKEAPVKLKASLDKIMAARKPFQLSPSMTAFLEQQRAENAKMGQAVLALRAQHN